MKTFDSKIGKIDIEQTYNEETKYNDIKLIDSNNKETIGYVNFKFNYSPIRSAWLNKIEVTPKYQSMGFGKVLLKLFERYCMESRIFYIEGKFFPENDHAKPFYLKNGYKIEKEYYETLITKTLNIKQKIDIEEMCK